MNILLIFFLFNIEYLFLYMSPIKNKLFDNFKIKLYL